MKRTFCPEKKRHQVVGSEKYKKNPRVSLNKQKNEQRDRRAIQNHAIRNYMEIEYYLS